MSGIQDKVVLITGPAVELARRRRAGWLVTGRKWCSVPAAPIGWNESISDPGGRERFSIRGGRRFGSAVIWKKMK